MDSSNKTIQNQVDKSFELLLTHAHQIEKIIDINDLINAKITENKDNILLLTSNTKTLAEVIKKQEELIIQQQCDINKLIIKFEENNVMVDALQVSVEISDRTIHDQIEIITDLKTRIERLENSK
jgi:hypothetical protein